MVIVWETKDANIVLLDEEITGNANPFTTLERTASGGILFKSLQFDEFDNKSVVRIELNQFEIENIKKMVESGML